MFILLVPFVSAGIYDSLGDTFSRGWDFVIDYWDFRILWAIGAIIAIGFRVKSHGSAGRMQRWGRAREGSGLGRRVGGFLWRHKWEPVKGGLWAGRKGREWRRVRKDRKLEENQLEIDKTIDKRITALTKVDEKLNQEEIYLDKRLGGLEEYKKRFIYWEERIGPYLTKVSDQILYIENQIKKGKLINLRSAQQNLERLRQQFTVIAQKHRDILKRVDGLIRAEAQLIIEKERRRQMEEANLEEEIRDEKGELKNLRREAKEAYDELVAFKKAGTSPRDIAIQKKKFKEINQRRRTLKKELRDEKKEEAINKKEMVIEQRLLARLGEQEKLIGSIELCERDIGYPYKAPEQIANAKEDLKDFLKDMKRNSRYIKDQIRKLRRMDRRKRGLEEEAEGFDKRRKAFTKKEIRTGEKEEREEKLMAA